MANSPVFLRKTILQGYLLVLVAPIAAAQIGPVVAKSAMVASSEPLATQVGLDILKKGGNAFDAAVAVGFALAVTYPQAGNLGGGGFMVGLTEHGTPLALDFRETAPRSASKNMFLDEVGNVRQGESLDSFRAVGVPGTVDGLIQIQSKFGKLTLQQDIEPAIKLAKYGFPVPQALHDSLVAEQSRLSPIGPTAAIFYPSGEPLAVGATLHEQDLAATLQRISDKGRPGFYEGTTAETFASVMEEEGGLITQRDLKDYHCKWRDPFRIRSGSDQLITMPLPSSGGIVLAQILGLTDLSALKSAGHNSAEYARQLVEAERLAYADRNKYLGDPDFVRVPVEQLVSNSYLEARRRLIPKAGAGSSKDVGPGDLEKPETTHYCAVDRWGNVAAVTYTLNGSYGMGWVLPGTGFFLNNEMDDFTSKPGVPNMFGLAQGEANAIAPGKRMLSSMSPTIMLHDGHFAATFGSPGGSTIITTVLQVFLNLSLFDMNIQQAVDAGRFHHQYLPDQIEYEPDAFTPDVLQALTNMGYQMKEVRSIGNVNAIERMPDGHLEGWSDRRGSGLAAGY